MSLVSVVLPFRNAGGTIEEAARSILRQSHRQLEVIAVDDGSDDHSVGELMSLADPRVRVVRNEFEGGIVGALNTGIRYAKGQWIARMDADDLSMPDRIEKQLDAAFEGAGVVTCGVELLNPCGAGMQRYVDWVNSLGCHDSISRARFIECPVIHPSVMIDRVWLDRVGGYRESGWAEDHDLWLRLLSAGCIFACSTGKSLHWRDSAERLTRRDPRYGTEARSKMRAHHLAGMELVREQGVVIAGAGPIGKRLARDLLAEGVNLMGLLDVHPRRIGQRIHGVEVRAAEAGLGEWQGAVLLGAVGLEGGREQLGALATKLGKTEGVDYWAVC